MGNLDKLIQVYSGTEITVLLLKDLLESNEIHCMIRNPFQTSIQSGFAQGTPSTVELFIEEGMLSKAQPILEAFKREN